MRKQIDELAKTLERVGYGAYAHKLRNIFRDNTSLDKDNTDEDDFEIDIDEDLNDEDIDKVDHFIKTLLQHKAHKQSNNLRKRLVTLRRRRR